MNIDRQVREVYSEIICDLSDRESCERWKSEHEAVIGSEKPLFSYMMATYNDESLFNVAVNSLLSQTFENWELIILDNSDRNPHLWEMIENAMYADKRIRGIKSDRNYGWPKAASICLQYVRGEYTTFLAADDCLCLNALDKMSKILWKESPDILWVGNLFVEYNAEHVALLGERIPQTKVYNSENRSEAIVEIMRDIYYNSFFHYMRVEFLKKYRIDFFDPYYADCAGMTEAMAKAEKMVSINVPVYCLTTNTSQTQGAYTWDSYRSIFVNQWKSIKGVFERESYKNNENIYFVVMRVFLNLLENIRILCLGHCRDAFMNRIEKTGGEIISQIEDLLCNEDIEEMFRIMGKLGFDILINNLGSLRESNCILNLEDIEKSRIAPILQLALLDGELTYGQQIELLIQWLMDDNNPACIGFYNFVSLLDDGGEMMIWKYSEDYRRISKKNKEFTLSFWNEVN